MSDEYVKNVQFDRNNYLSLEREKKTVRKKPAKNHEWYTGFHECNRPGGGGPIARVKACVSWVIFGGFLYLSFYLTC